MTECEQFYLLLMNSALQVLILAVLVLRGNAQGYAWFDWWNPCDYTCNECWYGYSNWACYDCGPNRWADNWQWWYSYCNCYTGYYDDGSSNACQPCAYQCYSCNSWASNCESCNGNYRGSAPSCSCIAKYYDNGSPNCQPCHYSCNKCSSGSSCSSCDANYGRLFVSGSSYCGCPARYYDPGYVNCIACHPTCLSCYGTATNNCLTCNAAAKRTLSSTTCVCTTYYYATSSTL